MTARKSKPETVIKSANKAQSSILQALQTADEAGRKKLDSYKKVVKKRAQELVDIAYEYHWYYSSKPYSEGKHVLKRLPGEIESLIREHRAILESLTIRNHLLVGHEPDQSRPAIDILLACKEDIEETHRQRIKAMQYGNKQTI